MCNGFQTVWLRFEKRIQKFPKDEQKRPIVIFFKFIQKLSKRFERKTLQSFLHDVRFL